MADFTRQQPGLNLAFPPSSAGSPHQPGRLDESVQLVHDFPALAARLNEVQAFVVNGGGGATFVDSPEAGPQEYFYVLSVHVSQPDAAQGLNFDMLHLTLAQSARIFTSQLTSQPTWPSNTILPVPRPFIIPPGFRIRATRDVGGAGVMQLSMLRVVYRLAEDCPTI